VFMSEVKRDRHLKFHHGDRTRACEVPGCSKTFSTTGNLNRHLKNHHSEEERRIYGRTTRSSFSTPAECSEDSGDCSDSSCDDSSSSSSPTTVDAGDWSPNCTWLGVDVVRDEEQAAMEPWTPEMLDILAQMLLD
jgi:hypothetical protein